MKLNKLLIMGIFLLAVILLGAVSAADDATADSIKLDNSIDEESIDLSFNSADGAELDNDFNEDIVSNSESITESDSDDSLSADDGNDLAVGENNDEINKTTTKLIVTPSAQTYKYGADVKLTISLTDSDDAGISGTVTVIVDDVDYLVNVSGGSGTLTISDLESGTYDILAIFNATDEFEAATYSDAQFVVNKSKRVTADVVVENATYGNPAVLKITNLCNVDGKKLSNYGGYQIVGPVTPYGSFFVSKGKATVNLNDLPAGNYTIYIVFGNNVGADYEFDNYIINFTVFEAPVNLSANASDYIYGLDGNLNVKVTDAKNKAISGKVNVTIDNEVYASDVDVTKGEANIALEGLSANEHLAEISFKADNYELTTVTINFTVISKIITNMAADNLVMSYKDGSAWAVTLTDSENNAMPNEIVKIAIVGKVYNFKTDENGVAKLPVNLIPGVYDVNATFEGHDDYTDAFISGTISVTKATAILSADNLVMNYKDGSSWDVSLVDSDGNAIGNVNVKVGIVGKYYNIKTDAEGVAKLPINLIPGNYSINASFSNSRYDAEVITASITVNKPTPILSGNDLSCEYRDGSAYQVVLTDGEGSAISNSIVKITVLGKTYDRKTNAEGVASLPINLAVGNYSISAKFEGNNIFAPVEINNSITVVKPTIYISSQDINMTYGDGTSYDVQLTDGNGNPFAIAGEIVKITIKGKTYERKTNANGIASLPINLIPGTYSIVAEYDGKSVDNEIIVNKS